MIVALLYLVVLFLGACAILIVQMGWTGVLAVSLIALFAIPLGMALARPQRPS